MPRHNVANLKTEGEADIRRVFELAGDAQLDIPALHDLSIVHLRSSMFSDPPARLLGHEDRVLSGEGEATGPCH
jgi:hypothetical protein